MTLAAMGKQEFSRVAVLQDFRQPELYQWADTGVTRFPTISKPQATGLASDATAWQLLKDQTESPRVRMLAAKSLSARHAQAVIEWLRKK